MDSFIEGMYCISKDWEIVINQERAEKLMPIIPQAKVKVICAIIPIVLDLWRRRCKVVL